MQRFFSVLLSSHLEFVPSSLWDDGAPRGVGRGSSPGFRLGRGLVSGFACKPHSSGSGSSPVPDPTAHRHQTWFLTCPRMPLFQTTGPGEGQKRCGPLPPSLKGQCAGGRDVTGNGGTWSGSSRGVPAQHGARRRRRSPCSGLRCPQRRRPAHDASVSALCLDPVPRPWSSASGQEMGLGVQGQRVTISKHGSPG